MLFSDSHILITILFTPLVGAILMLFIPRERPDLHRWMGNIFGFLGSARLPAADLAIQLGPERAAVPICHRSAAGFLRLARISRWESTA